MTGVQWAYNPTRNVFRNNKNRARTHVAIFYPELEKGHPKRVQIKEIAKGTVHHYVLAHRWAMVREIKGKLS